MAIRSIKNKSCLPLLNSAHNVLFLSSATQLDQHAMRIRKFRSICPSFRRSRRNRAQQQQQKTEMKPGEQLVHHSGRQQRLLISQEPIRLTTAMSHPKGTEHCSKTILFEERGGHSPSVGSVLVLGAFCARAAATRRSSSSRGEAWRQELNAGLISQLASTYSTPG
jgi:hypothetical protein